MGEAFLLPPGSPIRWQRQELGVERAERQDTHSPSLAAQRATGTGVAVFRDVALGCRLGLLGRFHGLGAPTLTTHRGHRAGQSPGDVRQLRRLRTALGCFPGSPFCQASPWAPEVCSSTACRTMDPGEEHHLLPSFVSWAVALGP